MGKNTKLISTWENHKSKLLKTIVIVSCEFIFESITLVIEHTTYDQRTWQSFGGKITWNTQSCITIIVETVLKGGKLLNIVDWNCIVKLVYRTMAEASSSQSKKVPVIGSFPYYLFKGPPSSKSHCDRLFLFWISLLSKRVIWLAERRQAVRKRAPSCLVLVSFKRLILQIYTEMWPNIYKITQENYRMINRERIYSGGLKYMCRIRL